MLPESGDVEIKMLQIIHWVASPFQYLFAENQKSDE